jgi:hypothetical protein
MGASDLPYLLTVTVHLSTRNVFYLFLYAPQISAQLDNGVIDDMIWHITKADEL